MVRRALVAIAILAVAIQLVPYGRGGDPAPGQEAPWPSAQARALAVESCYDCHSRMPRRPWFTQVAPASWLVQRDIVAARAKLDFTAWGSGEQEAHDAGEVIQGGSMPPRRYLLLHPGARLDAREREVLAAALDAMYGGGRGRGRAAKRRPRRRQLEDEDQQEDDDEQGADADVHARRVPLVSEFNTPHPAANVVAGGSRGHHLTSTSPGAQEEAW